MNENKKEQLAMNLAWLCEREDEGERTCPCLPQNGCPCDLDENKCPASRQDWLEWMNKEDGEGCHCLN